MKRNKQTRQVEAWLRETGLPWRIEDGGKHLRVILNGRMIQVIPTACSREAGRSLLNCRATIRRIAREAR